MSNKSELNIPLSAFNNTWYTEEWIALNSRGLFHHIGDNVSFFYGAMIYGDCYFLGRNQYNQLVTLSTIVKRYIEEKNQINNDYLGLFANLHSTDFEYIYGVPKGNPSFSDSSTSITTIEQDCKINDLKNIYLAEHYWENQIFKKYANRKMYVGSFEDKFIEILKHVKKFFFQENQIIIQKIIDNQTIVKSEIKSLQSQINENIYTATLSASSFFVKSLAHKTVCDIFNPKENLKLGFFMKNKGTVPDKKFFYIFDLLDLLLDSKKEIFKNPLQKMNNIFIEKYFKKWGTVIDLWSKDDKKGFLFSELISMENEYRMFIINNRVVATTACFRNTVPLNAWQNGRFDTRVVNGHNAENAYIDRKRVAQYAKFAKKYCQEIKEVLPDCKNYVLDVAWCEEKKEVVPIEINSITWSGAYQLNMHRLCAAIIQKPFQYDHLENFIIKKFENWIKMINEDIIEPCFFDLCGLERILKGKTLPYLEEIIQNYTSKIEKLLIEKQNIKKNIKIKPNYNQNKKLE